MTDGRRESEGGFTIIELMAALSVLTVAFFSLASAMGIGLRQVALARQRQTASELANAQLEHLRNYSYDSVALSDQPAHAAEESDPDHAVSSDGLRYDIPGTQGEEVLLVDSTDGRLAHRPPAETLGNTTLDIYQYVTWRDDPGITGTQDYKRVTIVVAFRAPAITVPRRTVSASSFVTDGTVQVTGSTSSPTQGSPSPTPSPSPTGTLPAECSGDTTPPAGDFTIGSGSGSETGYTRSTSISLRIEVTDACTPLTGAFSNDGTTYGEPVTISAPVVTVVWTVPGGDGTKQIWGRFTDGNSNVLTTGPRSLVLDTVAPSTPGTLTFTKSCTGITRTVNLSWGASTDTNFLGYRPYRSINGGAWTELTTVGTTSASDQHLKTNDSVRFYVVGYDKAGNESLATNTIELSKNQC